MNELRRICVYCGANSGLDPRYRESAWQLGAALALAGLGVVYGGGNVGLMGAVADGALSVGGEVIGVIPRALMEKELGHRGVSKLFEVGSMHERKALMVDLSDAFIALPGGFGTLDELFETLTWLQLEFHHKPIGLLNVGGYFDGLMAFVAHMRDHGFVKPEHAACLLVESDAAALLSALRAFSPPRLGKWMEQLAAEAR